MRKARVTEDEVLSAIRAQGHGDAAEVDAVVLETDGSFSVIGARGKEASSLRGIGGRGRNSGE